MLMKNAISLMGRTEDVCEMTSNMMRQLPPKPSCQEAFKNLVMNFILYQEEKFNKLEEYMSIIGNDFMQLSLEVIAKLKKEIKVEENRVKKIEKIMRYPDTEDLEPPSDFKFTGTLTKKVHSILLNSSCCTVAGDGVTFIRAGVRAYKGRCQNFGDGVRI
ncbi:hypothetical protein Tco_1085299 [Tanacetum coccineum]